MIRLALGTTAWLFISIVAIFFSHPIVKTDVGLMIFDFYGAHFFDGTGEIAFVLGFLTLVYIALKHASKRGADNEHGIETLLFQLMFGVTFLVLPLVSLAFICVEKILS